MADQLITVDSDTGPREPLPVTIMSAGSEVALGGTPKARTSLVHAQVAVTTFAAIIAPSRPNRDSVLITNTGTTDVYLGNANVTAANGVLLPGAKGASVSLPFAGALYAVTSTGTATVTVADVY